MNVSSMSTYNMSTLWSNLINNSSTISSISKINNVDSAVKEQATVDKYSGTTTADELQSIYEQENPTYGMPVTYDTKGNLTTSTTLPTDGLTSTQRNTISMLQNSISSSSTDSIATKESSILAQYTAIKEGTYTSSLNIGANVDLYT